MPRRAFVERQLAGLREQYRRQLPVAFGGIVIAWEDARAEGGTERWQAVLYEVHRLAGNAGVFGLAEISNTARALQALVEPWAEGPGGPAADAFAQADRHMTELHRLVAAQGDFSKSCLVDG